MGTKSIGGWREAAIATGTFVAWIGLAVILEKITGYDSLQLTSYGALAGGLGLMLWGWLRAHQSNALVFGFLIAGFGLIGLFNH